MQEKERQGFDGSPYTGQMQNQMNSQNTMQNNYDSLLYSEITENNETLLNTPQHPYKSKNQLLKNTQQGDSSQVSERQWRLSANNNTNNNNSLVINNNTNINTNNNNKSNITNGTINGKSLSTNQLNTSKNNEEIISKTGIDSQNQKQLQNKKSPSKINEFRIYTEEDELDDNNNDEKAIERMDMSGNMIQRIQRFENFPQLIYLNLSYNRISIIENLEVFPLLQHLDLSRNVIKDIPESIKINNLLENLLLSSNKICSIDSLRNLTSLQHLKQLDLLDNPVQSHLQYKSYIQNNLQQISLLDQKNIHVSNLNSIGESWNSQLSFTNPISIQHSTPTLQSTSIQQSAHFQKNKNKSNNQIQQQQQQQNGNIPLNVLGQGLATSIESLYGQQQLQNRQNHIYSFGSQQNDTPSNKLFGFELGIENNQFTTQKHKKPQSLDLQYQTANIINNTQFGQNGGNNSMNNNHLVQNNIDQKEGLNEYYYNNVNEINKIMNEVETDLDSDGNVMDKQYQEQRIYYTNSQSAKKKQFQAFLNHQKQVQLQQQFLASPQHQHQIERDDGSVLIFEDQTNEKKQQISDQKNPFDAGIDQTFTESANQNSFSQNTYQNKQEQQIQDKINFQNNSEKFEQYIQGENNQNQINKIQENQQIQNKINTNNQPKQNYRRNICFDEQVQEQFLPNLSEEEAYRLKKCLFQQNSDKIQELNNKQEQNKKNNQKNDLKEDEIDINLTNLHSISNYQYEESNSKPLSLNQQLFLKNKQAQPPALPARDEQSQNIPQQQQQQFQGNESHKITPFVNLNSLMDNQESTNNDQMNNQFNTASQIQSLFDNIESHRGDFLLQDFTNMQTNKKDQNIEFQENNIEQTPNQNDSEIIQSSEELNVNQNINNTEKQCYQVAQTLHLLASQQQSLSECFNEYKNRLDESTTICNQLISKIIKCSEENIRQSIQEKEKIIKDILNFKNDIHSSFELSSIFIAEFGMQISKFMSTAQNRNDANIEEININSIEVPKIQKNSLKNIQNLFEKLLNDNNQIFIQCNKITEELQKSKNNNNLQNDFLVQKLNNNIESLITLFKEISNLHLTSADIFENIQHTSERLTKYFNHIIRLLQAKQTIQYSSHKRNPSKDTLTSQQMLGSKPQNTLQNQQNKDSNSNNNINSRLNRQQSSKDFNLQSISSHLNSKQEYQQKINDSFSQIITQDEQQNQIIQQQQLIQKNNEKDEIQNDEQKKLMSSNIEQIQMQVMNYRKEQQTHVKNMLSEDLKLEELDLTQKLNLQQQNQNNNNNNNYNHIQINQLLQSNIAISPYSNQNQNKPSIINSSHIPISPHSPHMHVNQLKSNTQSIMQRSSKHVQELEVLKFKFSDFEKTSLQRYDSLLKTKEQVEKDYNQIIQNYSELQSNYENLLKKYSGLQTLYEDQLSLREKDNNEIQREELYSQISGLKLRLNDSEKQVIQSENQKQLILKDKQILQEQISLIQKDYQNIEKANAYNNQQNLKLQETNKSLTQQNSILIQQLNDAENIILNMKTVITPRLPELSQQNNEKSQLEDILKEIFENVDVNIKQNSQIISMLSNQSQQNKSESNKINQNYINNTNNIHASFQQDQNEYQQNSQREDEKQLEESNQEWSEMLKMQIQQKQLLYKQIQVIISTLSAQTGNSLLEEKLKIISIQETSTQSTQTDSYSLPNTQYQFYDSMISPPSKTSTVITQQNQGNQNSHIEDSNNKSNAHLLTTTTMTLPNILESVRKHQLQQTKIKSTTGNSSSTASEKLYKLAAQRCEEETVKNFKKVQSDKWFNNSPDRYCGLGKNLEENIEEGNGSSSQNSSSAQNRSLQKSRQILKQMTEQAKNNRSIPLQVTEDNNFLQTKKKSQLSNKSNINQIHNSSGQKQNLNKTADLLSQADRKTERHVLNSFTAKGIMQQINQSSLILNSTMPHEKPKRDSKSPSTKINQKSQQYDQFKQYQQKQQQLIQENKNINQGNQKKDNKQLLKKNNIVNTSSQNIKTNETQIQQQTYPIQNESAIVNFNSNINNISSSNNIKTINSNNNNNNTSQSTISHYKSNSNISDKAQIEHTKKQKNCLKGVINAYKNIQTLKRMQEILKTDDHSSHSHLNKTTNCIPVDSSLNNVNQSILQNINHSQIQNNNNNNNNNNLNQINPLNKVQKKASRSQSNLSQQNVHKTQNPININLFSQLMNINYSHCISARQKNSNFKSTRNIDSSQDFNAINLYNSAKQQQNSGSKVNKKKKKKQEQTPNSNQDEQINSNNNNYDCEQQQQNGKNSNFFQSTTNSSNVQTRANNTLTGNTNNIKNMVINQSAGNKMSNEVNNISQLENSCQNITHISNLNNTHISNLNNTYSNANNSNTHLTPNHTKSVSSILASIYQPPQQQQQQQLQQLPQQSGENAPYLVQDILAANQIQSQPNQKQNILSSVIIPEKNTQLQGQIQISNHQLYHQISEFAHKKKISFKSHLEDQNMSDILSNQMKRNQTNSSQENIQFQQLKKIQQNLSQNNLHIQKMQQK